MNLIIEALDTPILVIVLVFLIYWIMKWVKEIAALKEEFKQPVSLVIGTIISSLVLWIYDFRPIDLGTAKYVWADFLLQGIMLASLAGVFYDKFMKKLS